MLQKFIFLTKKLWKLGLRYRYFVADIIGRHKNLETYCSQPGPNLTYFFSYKFPPFDSNLFESRDTIILKV